MARPALWPLAGLAALLFCAGLAAALPDLRVVLTAPPSASDGEPGPVSVAVTNWGDAPAANVTVEVRLDGALLPLLQFGTVGAGAAVMLPANVTWVCGYHNVTATVDPANATAETDEANNLALLPVAATATARFTAVMGGELGAYNVTLDASASTGCPLLDYRWDAGEAGFRTGAQAVFEGLPAGVLSVTLRVTPQTDANLSGSSTQEFTVANAPPVLQSATMPASTVNTGTHIDLIVLAYDPDGAVAAYLVDFGDGHNASALGVISDYRYATPGNYTISVLVTDNLGATNSTTLSIQVRNRAPTAVTLSYVYTQVGDATKFDATASTDPEHGNLTAHWEFGDGGQADGLTATHAYAAPGTYTAKLRVTDPLGASNEVEIPVTVLGSPGAGGGNTLVTVLALGVLAVAFLYFLYKRRQPPYPEPPELQPHAPPPPPPPPGEGPAARVVDEGAPPKPPAP